VDAVRSRPELIIENAVLRYQVNVLRRRGMRPKLNVVDKLTVDESLDVAKQFMRDRQIDGRVFQRYARSGRR
jgi:hypothetical protein